MPIYCNIRPKDSCSCSCISLVPQKNTQPANVLVSSDGRVKLADFGIVSQRQPPPTEDDGDLEGTMASPMNHTVVGTTRYMSPERLRGMPYAWPSDVWSAGLVLLELRRGDSPFEDASSVVSPLSQPDCSCCSVSYWSHLFASPRFALRAFIYCLSR